MSPGGFDPGLTQQFSGKLRRVINKDGSFNVRRRGTSWRDFHPYLHLINIGWTAFLAIVFAGYLAVNTMFALSYYWIGTEQLRGAEATNSFGRFLKAFFFSAHTLTTVGFGSISPIGNGANIMASIEAMVGLMGFALATGILYGRVSRPSSRIGFSEKMLVAPYAGGTSLQFRIVNLRPNMLMELEAKVLLMTVESADSELRRNYKTLKLERPGVFFLPLTWTIVHPIDAESPLYGKTAADLEQIQAELLILIKGYDDTFSQSVHARYSYRYDELVWGGRFTPAFHFDEHGDMVVDVRKVHGHTIVRP